MNLDALHIAHPELVHGLWLWALLVGLFVWLERRGSDSLSRLVGRALEERLIERPAPWRRGLRLALFGLAGLAMVAALMQPQWGERFVRTPRVGAEIMIALDVSRSMLADDAKPTRLERAKAEISDLLAYLGNDQVGLIAFAGRASILSPMTPDKSFLRLALESAGPHSVSRGGTRLAEPILRAVAGLGVQGPAQRALLLITDGEDHESFALDAAKKAAAAGIKIITIGFGDEAGSQIYVSNPDDGSRTLVRDADGNPVVSRLDGELLREIALATDGAYVPAGTGVLDLASIYDTHIARLTRGQLDSRGRSIRGEIYQVFVAAALVCLVIAASVSGGRWHRSGSATAPSLASDAARPSPKTMGTAALVAGLTATVLLLGLASPSPAAQPSKAPVTAPANSPTQPSIQTPAQPSTQQASPALLPTTDPTNEPATNSAPAVAEDPRTRFNHANEKLAAGDPALASTLYREARRDAVDDVELRYAASYNLGMAAVAQADAVQATKPADALAHLHEAADWFREASAMQPGESDPRHNLDVTLRRALILADEIARKGDRDVEGELDQLIETQRGRVGEAALLLEAVVREGELAAADSLHTAFDAASTTQRVVLADGEALAERVANEKSVLDAKPEAERTPEEALRSVSLDGVLGYLDQGVERMGQMRRQLRQRSAERAYRRGAEALDSLKRARDQLRDPVEQIRVLLAEVAGVARATSVLATTAGATPADPATPAGASPNAPARLPAFLTPEVVTAETAAVEARVGELAERFATAATRASEAGGAGGAGGASADPAAGAAGTGEGAKPTISESLRTALVAAAPLVKDAHVAMGRSTGALGSVGFEKALAADGEAAEALDRAQELFFDLRELLNVSHDAEAGIAAVAGAADPKLLASRNLRAPELAALQARNRSRANRLESLLSAERESQLAALESPDPTAPADESAASPEPSEPPDPAKRAALEQRFTRAGELLSQAAGAMAEAGSAFGAGAPGKSADWPRIDTAAALATERLEALRNLFLSLVEQLARLEREQVDLADRTRNAIALAATDTPPGQRGPATRGRIEAVGSEQKDLEARAGAIADALVARSDEAPAKADGEGGDPGAPDRDTLRRAADHVATGQLAMQEAVETFSDERKPLAPAAEAQGVARDELRKALEILSPPPPEKPPEPPKDDSKSGQDESPPKSDSSEAKDNRPDQGAGSEQDQSEAGGDEAASASEDQMDQPSESQDPGQLMQGVRDREAERRQSNERRERQQRRSAPVEKDW